MIQPAFEILNQRGTPMFFSDVFANRPAAGIIGRIFISTDTKEFYRDTGSTWELIGGPGSGTITGSGTAGTLPLWSTSSSLSNSDLIQLSSKALTLNNPTSLFPSTQFDNDAGRILLYSATNNPMLICWGNSAFGSGNECGTLSLGNVTNLGPTTFGGSILEGWIENAIDGSGFLKIQTTNSLGTLLTALTINSTQQIFTGNAIASSGKLVVNNSSADAHVQVVGANSPSIRIDNAGTGATQRFVMGLATATNNFIQGSAAGNVCISTASASPILFGMWQTINASEVMRISTANNLIVGSSVDNGNRLQITGSASISNDIIIGINFRIDANGDAYQLTTGGAAIYGATGNVSFPTYGFYNNTGLGMYRAGANTLSFATSSTERMRITSGGNLLLGTTTDSGQRLQVNGTSLFSSTTTFASTGGSGLRIYGGSGTNQWDMYLNGANLRISDNTGGGSFRIDTSMYLLGSLRIDGQRSGTAGGNSGQHLIINCDGITYKIALLNP